MAGTRITVPYLLVLNIALARHDGRHWAPPLWAKDLLLHLDYIAHLTLFCPVDAERPPADWVALDHPGLTIVASGPSGRRGLIALPFTMWRLAGAVRRARIVHTGVAGWPLPLGWLAAPLARLFGRFLIIIIESSFWRAAPDAPFRKRASAAVHERIARACVNAADLALFTTDQYRRSLATHPRGVTQVTPASWLDADQVLSPSAAQASWQRKPARLLFAGRLTAEKGVACLLDAIERGDAAVDIVGEGELIDGCRAAAARHPDRVRLLAPVAYGSEFSALLDDYAAVILPTLTDEQPRILFDAFARALPVIASDTAANAEIVGGNNLGWLLPRGDAAALAEAMRAALADPAAMQAAGLRALAFCAAQTHEAMHRHRADLIAQTLAGRS